MMHSKPKFRNFPEIDPPECSSIVDAPSWLLRPPRLFHSGAPRGQGLLLRTATAHTPYSHPSLCPFLRLLPSRPAHIRRLIFAKCCFALLGTMAFPAFLTALAPLPLAPSPRVAVCTRRALGTRRPAGLRMLGGATPPTPPPADGDDKVEAPAAAEASTDAAAAPEATATPDVPTEDAPAADAETTADDILSSPAFLKKKMEVRLFTYTQSPWRCASVGL